MRINGRHKSFLHVELFMTRRQLWTGKSRFYGYRRTAERCDTAGWRASGKMVFYDFLVYIKISVFTKTISMSCEMLCPKRQMLNWCVSWTNLISRRRKKTTVCWCNIFIKMIKPECVLPYNQTSIFALNQSIASLNYIHRTLNLSLSLSLKRTKTTPRFNSKQDNWFAYLYKCVCVCGVHSWEQIGSSIVPHKLCTPVWSLVMIVISRNPLKLNPQRLAQRGTGLCEASSWDS